MVKIKPTTTRKRKAKVEEKKVITRSFGVKAGTKIRIVCAEGREEFNGKEGVVLEVNEGNLKGTWGDLELMPTWDKIEVVEK